MAHMYWFAFVGNVLGTPITTFANGWRYSGTFGASGANGAGTGLMWMPGWNSDAGNATVSDSNLTSFTYMHRHGNYDYVTPGINDWNASYSRGLPNSYHLGSRPAFFTGASCTYPWPPVTP